MSKLTKLAAAFLALAVVLTPTAFGDDKAKLDGRYSVVSGERDGKAMEAKDIEGCVLTVNGDKIIATGKDGKEFLNCTFTADESKKPCVVTLKGTGSNAGKTWLALSEKTADGFRVIYQMEGGEAPTDFKTKEKQVLLVLKREEK